MKYDFAAIEKKWQDKWEEVKPYAAVTGSPSSSTVATMVVWISFTR